MANSIKQITLEELEKDDSFLKDLKAGNYVLVLGAGFSFGLKNKSGNEIPIVTQFTSLTTKKFGIKINDGDFNQAADAWQRYTSGSDYNTENRNWEKHVDDSVLEDSKKASRFQEFKDLFLIDEETFSLNKYLYKNILTPNWSRIYTFNFDNVLDILIQNCVNKYEVQYHETGSFLGDNRTGIGYLHNSILKANSVKDLVFTNSGYSSKIHTKNNHLYFSLFNDIKIHKKNLLIIGCQFNEQTISEFLFSENVGIRSDQKIINISYNAENIKPNYGLDIEDEIKYNYWVNCKTEDFLSLIWRNQELVSKHDPIPIGLKRITLRNNHPKVDPQLVTFNHFLENDYLDYESRMAFARTLNAEERKTFVTEHDLIKYIDSNDSIGLIIYGQGGIGKTRLMLELGKSYLKPNNNEIKLGLIANPISIPLLEYEVLEIKKDLGDFKVLVSYINESPSSKFILLFDYVEEQKIFEKTALWISDRQIENVKIIANCRNSYINTIKFASFGENFKYIDIGLRNDLGIENRIEKKYKKEIILSIIKSIADIKLLNQLHEENILSTFYQARPSFAAFIKYIHQKNPLSDLNILANESFAKWLIKRLKLSISTDLDFSAFFEKKKYIFYLLSCLPANHLSVEKIEKLKWDNVSLVDEITKLIKDGWIDEDNESLKVVHDTVNDILLLEFFNNFRFRETYLNDLLDFGVNSESISSLMWSIQRIWDSLNSNIQDSWQKVIAKFIDKTINEVTVHQDWYKLKIDNTHLIKEIDRIHLLIKHKKLLKDTFLQEKFGSSLAYSMNWVSKDYINEDDRLIFSQELKQLFFEEWNVNDRFKDLLKDTSVGGKIISSYINLYGIDDYIKSKSFDYFTSIICNKYNLNQISFVLVAWLNHDGSVSPELANVVSNWFDVYLNKKPKAIDPFFLINSWLEKGNNISIVLEFIKKELINPEISEQLKAEYLVIWLKKNDQTLFLEPYIVKALSQNIFHVTAYQIIGFWLSKNKNPLIIKPFLEEWLKHDIETNLMFHIYQNWLLFGDDPDLIAESLKRWLSRETNQVYIGHTLSSFLNKKGNYIPIINEILIWLKQNTSNNQAVYVLGFLLSNLRNNSLLKQLETVTTEILNNFATVKESGYILGYWIEDCGKLSVIEPFINQWLAVFWKSEQSISIIGKWLEKKGNYQVIKAFIIPCLDAFRNDNKISKLMLNWLMHGNDVYYIEDYIKTFFEIKENQELYESRYLITKWLEKSNKPLVVKKAVKFWLKANCRYKESRFVCSYWLQKGDDITLVKDYIKSYFSEYADLKDSNFIIENWIVKGGDLNIIEKIIIKNLNKSWDDNSTLFIASIWLNNHGSLNAVNSYVQNNLVNYSRNKDCAYVIYSWLKNNGDFNSIKNTIFEYLKFYWEHPLSFSIIKQCIILNEINPELEKYIIKITEKFENNPFSNFIEIKEHTVYKKSKSEIKSSLLNFVYESKELSIKIKNYLLTEQSPDFIKKDVIDFLSSSGQEPYASHVLAAWIEFGNDISIIESILIEWLNIYILESLESCFVISAALLDERGFIIAHDKALEWLANFGNTYNSKFILSSWLKLKGNVKSTEIDYWIVYWFENLYIPESHNWRDELLLNYVLTKNK